jgi:hypothetical protein
MGIVYKISCDRCAEEYPEEIDSEKRIEGSHLKY